VVLDLVPQIIRAFQLVSQVAKDWYKNIERQLSNSVQEKILGIFPDRMLAGNTEQVKKLEEVDEVTIGCNRPHLLVQDRYELVEIWSFEVGLVELLGEPDERLEAIDNVALG
jgi:hypothetical protein